MNATLPGFGSVGSDGTTFPDEQDSRVCVSANPKTAPNTPNAPRLDVLGLCDRAGIRLFVAGGWLRFDAPQGAMTPGLRAALAAHRDELIAYLVESPPAPEPLPAVEPEPTAEPDPLPAEPLPNLPAGNLREPPANWEAPTRAELVATFEAMGLEPLEGEPGVWIDPTDPLARLI